MDVLSSWTILMGIASFLAAYLYRHLKWERNYFSNRGVKNLPFDAPFLGYASVVMQREHINDVLSRIYQTFSDQKYVGYKQFNSYFFLLRDVELIKKVAIKDFDHFSKHFLVFDEDMDSIFGNILFALKGEKWHDMRATLSPAFTSSKMRNIFEFVIEIGQQMVDFYVDKLNEKEVQERGIIEVEMKDAFTRYTNDVIATTAFGLKVNSLTKRHNEFYKIGQDISQFSGMRLFKILLITSFPFIKGFVKAFSEKEKHFFRNIILGTIKERKEKCIIRNDMIQLLMRAREGSLTEETSPEDENETNFAFTEEAHMGQRTVRRKWTDDDIVAQAVVFFIAGFETSATALGFLAHELTLNQKVQKQLQAEIDNFANTKKNLVTYEDLTKMTYLDMVVSETLRKWPPLGAIDRECVKDYELPVVNLESNKPCTIRKGEAILIPIQAIHRDPKYYPNPEKFDPTRFSEENKHKIKQFTYMPFGVGLRNCIGSRFALMEVKAIIFQMLRTFDFVPTDKTQNPIKLSTKTFSLTPENGFWIGLKPRKLESLS